MKFVFASYVSTNEFTTPEAWLKRINFYSGILESLSKRHTVISIEHINYEGEYLNNGVSYHFRRLSKAGHYLPYQQHRVIKNLNPDVVFIQGLHSPLQVMQLRCQLGGKVKVMAQHHAERPFTGIKRRLQRLASRYIDACLFASKAMGMEWVNKGNINSARKIHEVMELSSVFYPVNKEEAIARTGLEGDPVFLWVGRLNQNKDPLNVVNAFLAFADTHPSARLYMIYHTTELLGDIKAVLNKPGIAKNAIVLIGKVAHHELLYWYNSADFIVSGSFYEGSGTAVCEAMSCGCIPVLTDIPSFRMMTDNGQCGILYEPGNQQALLSALLQTQQINIQKIKEMAISYYKSNLSFEAIALKIEQIAQSI